MSEYNKYANSCIYKITNTLLNLSYIGATIQNPQRRFIQHKNKAHKKMCTSHILFLDQDIKDIKLEILENINCKDKLELSTLEKKYIKEHKCINKNIPLRKYSEYYQDKKEIIKIKNALYHYKNRDKVLQRKRDKYQQNKADLLKPIICECGLMTCKHHKARHNKTQQHINRMELLAGLENLECINF